MGLCLGQSLLDLLKFLFALTESLAERFKISQPLGELCCAASVLLLQVLQFRTGPVQGCFPCGQHGRHRTEFFNLLGQGRGLFRCLGFRLGEASAEGFDLSLAV